MPLPTAFPPLELLKRQARRLLRDYRAADPEALRRFSARLPRMMERQRAGARPIRLADALLVVAREHGYPSWPQLVRANAATIRLIAPSPRLVARAQATERLALTVTALAAAGDITGLTRALLLPRRDLLAVRALLAGQSAAQVVVDALVAGLTDPSPRIRFDCAHALDHFAEERCVPALRRLLDDPVPRVRRMALHVLSCAPCKLTPLPTDDDLVARIVHHALTDPSIQVRRHAATALGACGIDPRAHDTLRQLLARERDLMLLREARGSLRRVGRQQASHDASQDLANVTE